MEYRDGEQEDCEVRLSDKDRTKKTLGPISAERKGLQELVLLGLFLCAQKDAPKK